MFFRKVFPLLFACCWLASMDASSQEQRKADSLARVYQQNTHTGTAKLELLTDLAFNETHDLKKALEYVEELISLSEKYGYDNYLRRGYFLKGTKKRMLGQLDEALDAYFKSAEIAMASHHIIAEGEAYGAIADTYATADNFTNAMQYYRKGIAILRQSKGNVISLAAVMSNAGDAYLKSRHYDSALFYFNQAKLIFDRSDYLSGIGYSLGNIGMVYSHLGKNELAEKNIHEAMRILETTGDYYPISVYLLALSDMYVNKGDQQVAFTYASRSLQLAEQYGLKEQIAAAHLKLSALYERAGKTEEALKHFKKHIVYRDSVNNLQTAQRMGDQRTNYEIRQQNIQVNMLKQEKKNQQLMLIALFIILGLAILLLGVLYWFFKSKNREKMRMHEQEMLHAKLEIQEQTYQDISQELHDNIGQVLSVVKINLNTVDIRNAAMANEKLTASTDLLAKAIHDLRDVSKTLNTDFLNEISLPKAIEQQLEVLKRTGVFSTQLIVDGEVDHYEPGQKLLVFRVVQELLNNIIKHAQANDIVVALHYQPEKLMITVKDNGIGFDIKKQQLNSSAGLGLRNILNRLKLIKGTISFNSEGEKGTLVTIEISK